MTPAPENLRESASAAAALDGTLVTAWLVALGVGLLAVSSASVEIAAESVGMPAYFAIRHAVFIGLAAAAFALVVAIPCDVWLRVDRLAYVVLLGLLILVLIPGVGHEVNGARRWLGIAPGASLQPAELARFMMVIFLAGHLSRHRAGVMTRFTAMLRVVALVVPVAALITAEPDFGSAVLIMVTAAALLFLAGARIGHLLVLAVGGAAALTTLILTQPYRTERLQAFLDPWREEVRLDAGYQLTQALIAFGRGEWFGMGLGDGLQKLFFLPEAHTDFIFAVIAEETGVLGACAVIALLLVPVVRGMLHGRRAERSEAVHRAMLAYGAATLLAAQLLISLGVNTGLLPTKGLTLPLISYGGNSLIVTSALIALLVRAEFETRCEGERVVAGARRRREAPR